MIYIDVNGRCGNQMFQYAFARKLSLLNNDSKLILDFYHVSRVGKKLGDDNTFVDQLINFNVIPYSSKIETGDSVLMYGSKKQKRLVTKYPFIRRWSFRLRIPSILRKHQFKLQKNGVYREDECVFIPQKSKENNIFIKGYFEDPFYFEDIKSLLRFEFTPKFPKKEKNKKLYDLIENKESVCVSFRVWNEIKSDPQLYTQRNVCDLNYYLKAMNKMHELYPNSCFIIFSNCIDYIKKNVKFDYPVVFEDGNDEVWEKMRLMYSCKHFIMSTSTFCWWAQYLCRNDKKTVICPLKWTADGAYTPLIQKDWILL